MPAAAKSSKSAAKPDAKDIRVFFSGNKDQPQKVKVADKSKAIKGTKKNDAIEISDTDEKSSKKPTATTKPTPAKSSPKKPSKQPTVIESDSDDEAPPPPKTNGTKRKAATAVISSDEDEQVERSPPKKKRVTQASSSTTTASPSTSKSAPPKPAAAQAKPRASTSSSSKPKPKAKAKSKDDDYEMSEPSDDDEDVAEDDDDEEDFVPKASTSKKVYKPKTTKASATTTTTSDAKKPAPAPAPAPAAKDKDKEADKSDASKPKFNYAAMKAARAKGPVAPGSKQVPEDAEEDCLAGLTFVFTGELSSFSRDESLDIAKRFGGRVTGAPSRKTDYVVVGENAGEKKLQTIKTLGIKSLDEDGFLALIKSRKGGKPDEATQKKRAKDQAAIEKAAKEMEKREKAEMKELRTSGKSNDLSGQLWTTKYAPKTMKEICGNKAAVDKLLLWLQEWQKSFKSGFKKPGKHAMGMYRAVLVTGSPGIGKTTSAHMCAKLAGYVPIELNASDTRSKKLVEGGLNINNQSLDGWMGAKARDASDQEVQVTEKSCIIMDEVDGMSAGDRGGVGALNALIKKTKIPIICIANDRNAQKLKPLLTTTFSLKFSKPEATSIRSRIMSIIFKEKMKIPANVVDQLIAGAQSDIRQVLNMLSTWRLSHESMSFDEGKSLAKANEKYSIMSPFDVTNKVLGPFLFGQTARETLGDKMELYFHDHSFVPLFIQENYVKTIPSKLKDYQGVEKSIKQLDLLDKAASSISDGDLVDALIHGKEQQWSLMPLHAVCSTIRPASHIYGGGLGWGGANPLAFPAWLGQNSKQNKLSRQLADVQIKMRLKVTGDKFEVRRNYMPALYPRLVQPLVDEGTDAVDGVIDCMDEYYLSKEDWEGIVELGVGERNGEATMKKIPTAVKTAFTRKYNTRDHPIAFHKGLELSGGAPKKLPGSGVVPDIEDAFDNDDDVADDDEPTSRRKPVNEIESDKMLKEKKPKANSKAPAKVSGKGAKSGK